MIVRLANPGYLLLVVPVGIAAWVTFRHRGSDPLVFSARSLIAGLPRTWRLRVLRVLPALFWLGLVLAVTALARPQAVLSRTQRTAEAAAIEMAVDVSGSMDAPLLPDEQGAAAGKAASRLDAVKQTFGEFVKRRPDDLIGLVTFGGYAVTQVPLTFDHDALLRVLTAASVPRRAMDEAGAIVNQEELLTALGDGLAMACARLKDAAPRSKAIVLLSDGRQTPGLGAVQPDAAMLVAKKLGIKVYTIGVGPEGADALSPDKALLARIADGTGGMSFHATDRSGLDKALRDIDRLEKTTVARVIARRHSELFAYVLTPGLVLLVLAGGANMVWLRKMI